MKGNVKGKQPPGDRERALWEVARSGQLRAAVEVARKALEDPKRIGTPASNVELHLICASCAMRQGEHAEAIRELEAAAQSAASARDAASALLRVDVWRAELAYFQGRYSDANATIARVLPQLEARGDLAYAAFALRIRIATLLARTDYDSIAALADHAVALAEASGDDYVLVQVLNVLGAVAFDRATAKLRVPHARAHLSSLDPHDTAPMEEDAREALAWFQRARTVAERARYEFAAWYVAGNIERLEIVLGHADRAVKAIRKRLGVLQARGAKYEIVTRSNLAWGLRTMGHHREALHELDVALELARGTGTFNVLLEFLEYDRSIVLDALGDFAAARASYRRYLQLVGATKRDAGAKEGEVSAEPAKRPLEPYFLKRADRFIQDHLAEAFSVDELATQCGVSLRTLEKSFVDFRGMTPVAHVRNVRLDHARAELAADGASVADVAARCGFKSSTTFALEYRKRFGVPPSHVRRASAN